MTSPGVREGRTLLAWLGQGPSPPLLAGRSAKKTLELHKNPSWKYERHP